MTTTRSETAAWVVSDLARLLTRGAGSRRSGRPEATGETPEDGQGSPWLTVKEAALRCS